VSASPLGVVDACGLLHELREASDGPRRPVMIGFSTDDAGLDWAEWDQWLPRSTAPSEVARAVAQALEPR
jgi:hypothetical protein